MFTVNSIESEYGIWESKKCKEKEKRLAIDDIKIDARTGVVVIWKHVNSRHCRGLPPLPQG